MKKLLSLIFVVAFALTTFAQDVIPTSFPRKYLIEHFTGEACVYCPGGMDAIADYMKTHNCVWLSHHYGYNNDEYTIPANQIVGEFNGVQGAPNVSLNRDIVSWKYNGKVGGNSAAQLAFHPGYLEDLTMAHADTAVASVIIENTFANDTLTVHVHGQVGDTSIHKLLLSVSVKESGLIGKQQDAYNGWGNGWLEFVHTNVARAFLSAVMGDTVVVTGQTYDKTYTFPWKAAWNATNSSVVAYLTDMTKKPVINANEAPVVSGTAGGSDIEHGGITVVPYSESGAPKADITCTTISKQADGNFTSVVLRSTQVVRASNYSCTPYLELYVATTQPGQLPDGTYPVAPSLDSLSVNMVVPGFLIEEDFVIGGSQLYYVYPENGKLYIIKSWLLVGGEIVVEDGGKYIHGTLKTFNGKSFTITYGTPTPVDDVNALQAPVKFIENGQLIIRQGDKHFNLQGVQIR